MSSMGTIDFTLASPVLCAIVAALLLPAVLLAATRLSGLRGHNAAQFAGGALAIWLLWGGSSLAALARSQSLADIASGAMILTVATLFYLEVWALLSRGYTLGLLLTLLGAGRPLREDELAREYRGGGGLSWIMRHRVAGLVATRLVASDGDRIALTRWRGLPVAWCYKISIAVLGLKRTG
jgi:hypothetical protein